MRHGGRLLPWPTAGGLLCHRQYLADIGGFDPELDVPYGEGNGQRPMTAVAGDLQLVGQLAAKAAVATLLERARFQIPQTGLEILGTARLVQQQYASLDLDLADAVNVALAARYRTDAVLTLDRRGFRAMRPLTSHKWFRLLPDDL